jgi:predicted lipoprotein with Yx(FWY)xxD motif
VPRNSYLLRASLAVVSAAVGFGLADAVATAASTRAPALEVANVSITVNGQTGKQASLVTGSGRAVYMLTGNSRTHPECVSSACLGAWPAVTSQSKKPTLGKGVKGKVAIWRHKGIDQLTINGHPLYTFAGDHAAGVAHGEGLTGFGGTWKVLTASGVAASIKSSSVGMTNTGTTTSTTTTDTWTTTTGTTPSGTTTATTPTYTTTTGTTTDPGW